MALVGQSGSGKTSCVSLLQRLYDCQASKNPNSPVKPSPYPKDFQGFLAFSPKKKKHTHVSWESRQKVLCLFFCCWILGIHFCVIQAAITVFSVRILWQAGAVRIDGVDVLWLAKFSPMTLHHLIDEMRSKSWKCRFCGETWQWSLRTKLYCSCLEDVEVENDHFGKEMKGGESWTPFFTEPLEEGYWLQILLCRISGILLQASHFKRDMTNFGMFCIILLYPEH